MRRLAIGIVVVLLATALPVVASFGEDRVALAVGINNYAKVGRLEKADADARAAGDTLRRLGFKVDLALDVDRRGFNRAISGFLNKIKPGAIAYFHYSGHGVSIDNDTYLIPADMDLPNSDDREFVKRESIRLSELIDSLKNTKASARVLVIDACRENPFASRKVRGIGKSGGIALLPSAEGMLILYSAADGQLALDGLGPNDKDPNSVYTRTLLKHLPNPGQSMVDIAREVRREVEQLARTVGHEQRPAYYDELSDDLRLTAAADRGAAAPTASPQPMPGLPATILDEPTAGDMPAPSTATTRAADLASGAPPPGSLVGISLPGSNMRTIRMSEASPAACQAACKAESRCAAWTYIEPGHGAVPPRCALKAVIPAQVANACCTSGTERPPDPALNTPPEVSATVSGAMRGIDLPGLNQRSFVMIDPDPAACQAGCRAAKNCAAWTYTKAGILGPNAICMLKHGVPTTVASPCCVSGIETKVPAGGDLVADGGRWLTGINLPGSDYYTFQVKSAEPRPCQRACRADQLCAAWTYIEPGMQGAQARCSLKNRVPPQVPAACCTSGIERPALR